MSTRSYLNLVLALQLGALSSQPACGRPISIPDIQKLTADSNLIVVADVESVNLLRTIEFPDHTKGQQVTAVLKFDETLKGKPNTNILHVTYDYNPEPMMGGPWTPNLTTGGHMLLFLQCAVTCRLTSPEHSGFSIERARVTVPPPAEPTPSNKVLQRLAASLFSRVYDSRADTQPFQLPELFTLSEQRHSPYVDDLLHAALEDLAPNQHPDLRCELLAALVRRGDLDQLPKVQEAVMSNMGNAQSQQNMVYSLQGIDWHLTLPIAADALRASSPEVRVAVVRSIPNLGRKDYVPPNDLTAPATHVLLQALDDPDPEVVFAAMQSLGYLNARLDQRPITTSHDAKWNACIRFWRSYKGPM